MKNKIGILTFSNIDNYGAVLQTYALFKHGENLGNEVWVIDYVCDKIKYPYKIKYLKKDGIKKYIMTVIAWLIKVPRYCGFQKFRKYIKYTSKFKRDYVRNIDEKFDKIIVGSDQVWNPNLTDGDNTFLLDFVQESSKKLSYAASFGINSIPEHKRQVYIDLLSEFSEITVREKQGIEIVENLLKKVVKDVVDPTLLLSRDEWATMAQYEKTEKEKYIFVYQMGMANDMLKFAKRLSKEKGYKLIVAPFPIGNYVNCSVAPSISPQKWISLIENAEYVVTDSFHGTVFSLIFEKQFYTFISPMVKSLSSRVETLLLPLGLEERVLCEQQDCEVYQKIDYSKVTPRLEERIRESKMLLDDMIRE